MSGMKCNASRWSFSNDATKAEIFALFAASSFPIFAIAFSLKSIGVLERLLLDSLDRRLPRKTGILLSSGTLAKQKDYFLILSTDDFLERPEFFF